MSALPSNNCWHFGQENTKSAVRCDWLPAWPMIKICLHCLHWPLVPISSGLHRNMYWHWGHLTETRPSSAGPAAWARKFGEGIVATAPQLGHWLCFPWLPSGTRRSLWQLVHENSIGISKKAQSWWLLNQGKFRSGRILQSRAGIPKLLLQHNSNTVSIYFKRANFSCNAWAPIPRCPALDQPSGHLIEPQNTAIDQPNWARRTNNSQQYSSVSACKTACSSDWAQVSKLSR